jgi:guanylate kinase
MADLAASTRSDHGVSRPAGLTVLSGPSGVGKSTVVQAIRRDCPQVWLSVSVTTRRPRPGEQHGREYYFVGEREFEEMAESGRLLEWARFAGNYYGTPSEPVAKRLNAGIPGLVEVDVVGARQVRVAVPDSLLVFLAPPSWEELVRRLTGRETEPAEVIEQRLEAARAELRAESEFDITLVNTSVGDVCAQLVALMTAQPADQPAELGFRSGRQKVAGTPAVEGIINPPIDELLDVVESKYGLVIMASKRARQINAYYGQLGEGLLEYVGPLVETRVQEKPLSIALREISEGLLQAESVDVPAS